MLAKKADSPTAQGLLFRNLVGINFAIKIYVQWRCCHVYVNTVMKQSCELLMCVRTINGVGQIP
jgi:hypothetical protein